MTVVVIADIVGSRQLADRAAAQRALDEAIVAVDQDRPLALERLRPTVGDEQQGVYATLETAMASVMLLQLRMPEGVECRFGIGVGDIRTIASNARDIPEGPGWWSARAAIDHVRALQMRAAPAARTWIVAAPEQDESVHRSIPLANAYLLARDQIVGAMSARARRLTYGRFRGTTQRDLAAAEGITQPAISQTLAAAGSAALLEGLRALLPSESR